MTRRLHRWAMSRSQRGGAVYVRTAFTPFVDISEKSCSTTLGEGNALPSMPGRNVPYVTPRTKSFSWPAHRNLPPKTTREPSQTVFEGETRSRTSSGSETGTSAGALIGIILTDISALHLN